MLFLDHDHTSKDPLAETILSDDGCLTEARFSAKGGKETACVAMVRGKKGCDRVPCCRVVWEAAP